MRATVTHTLNSRPTELTAGDLVAWAASLDPAAKVSIHVDHGDRPGEMGVVRLTASAELPAPSNEGPHSRACGFTRHDHGPACSSNCPTCGGRPLTTRPTDQAAAPTSERGA